MKLLAIEKEIINHTIPDDYQQLLKAEAKEIWQLIQTNVIREIYFTERKNAVIILECDNACEAARRLAELPLVKGNLIEFEIMELNAYSGFERLFEKS